MNSSKSLVPVGRSAKIEVKQKKVKRLLPNSNPVGAVNYFNKLLEVLSFQFSAFFKSKSCYKNNLLSVTTSRLIERLNCDLLHCACF